MKILQKLWRDLVIRWKYGPKRDWAAKREDWRAYRDKWVDGTCANSFKWAMGVHYAAAYSELLGLPKYE